MTHLQRSFHKWICLNRFELKKRGDAEVTQIVLEHGTDQHLKPIAAIYRDAFPESVQLFFSGKDPVKLLRLLTNAFTFLYLTGARIMVARKSNSDQVLGYCVYTSPKNCWKRTSLLVKNLGKILKLALALLRDLHLSELARLAANSVTMGVHTRVQQKLPRRCSQIASIAVHPACQGQGIGKALFTRVLNDLAKENVRLNVRPYNKPALHLYENSGFTACGSTKDLQGPWLMMIRRA